MSTTTLHHCIGARSCVVMLINNTASEGRSTWTMLGDPFRVVIIFSY